MDREKVIKGLQIERECVSRDCDRDCGKCDLVQDRDWLLSVYDDALALLKDQNDCENCAIAVEDRQPVIRCKYCNHSTEWYGDKRRCFLWAENGIDVFEDGYCSYGRPKEGR